MKPKRIDDEDASPPIESVPSEPEPVPVPVPEEELPLEPDILEPVTQPSGYVTEATTEAEGNRNETVKQKKF